MKKYLFLLLLLVKSVCLLAQTPQDDLKKYWYYRERLVHDFLKPGIGQGHSIPAGVRWHQNQPQLLWGDETVELGWYIGVLATEYKLLQLNGQSTTKTKQELYYALETFNRLDYTAESYWGGTNSLNGFFIRGDADSMFWHNNKLHFNQKKYSKLNVHKIKNYQYPEDTSGYVFYPNNKPTDPTIDQIIPILMGMTLVAKLCNPFDSYNLTPFMDGEIFLAKEAQNIAHRLIIYLKSNSWSIKNPVTNDCIKGICDNLPTSCLFDSECGASAVLFSYAIAESGNFITGNNYHDNISLGTKQLWETLQFIGSGAGIHSSWFQEAYKITTLAAISSSWHFTAANIPPVSLSNLIIPDLSCLAQPYANVLLNYVNSNFNLNSTCLLTQFNLFNSTSLTLPIVSALTNTEINALLHQVLHGGSNSISNQHYKNLLHSAPCVGPFNFGSPSQFFYAWDIQTSDGGSNTNGWFSYPVSREYEWSSTQRFIHVQRRGASCFYNCAFGGEYNGLDYMLLHNLYYLVDPDGDLPSYVNHSTVDISNYTFPVNFPLMPQIGSHTLPLTVKSFSQINAFNITLTSDANVTLVAGDEIIISGEFSTEQGAEFHAYIQRPECIGPVLVQSINQENNQDSGEESLLYNIPDYTFLFIKNRYLLPENQDNKLQEEINASSNSKINTVLNSKVLLFPNPNNGTFTIYVQTLNEQEQLQLSVMDVYGKQLLAQQINNSVNHQIDLSAYSKGIYYVSVTGTNGFREVKKVVVN
jgi:hypothetical protein